MAADLIGQTCDAPDAALQSALPLIEISPGVYFRWKSVFGRIAAVFLLVPALPVIGVLVLLVRLTSPGPGIFRQVRVGLQGQIFLMYKIRTMVSDAERQSGPTWTSGDDPRITRLGSVLRKLHLDELPQLFNVVRGEMSLIGPRPERPEFIAVLEAGVPGYINRLAVRPGVTGLAQVNLPPDTDLQSVRRKLALDLEYIRTANLLLDVRLLIYTATRLLGVPCRFAVRVMQLHRPTHESGRAARSVTLSTIKQLAGSNLKSEEASPHESRRPALDATRDTAVNSIYDTLPDVRTLDPKIGGNGGQNGSHSDRASNGHSTGEPGTNGDGREHVRRPRVSSGTNERSASG